MADDNAPAEGEENTPDDQGTDSATEYGTEALGDAGKQALDRMKAERNEAKQRAKELEKELDKVRKSSMSEAEKAVAEAEARGRAEAATQFGTRLVRSEFVAAAAKRNATFDASAVLDDLNLAKFVNDDGDPDQKAIAAAVNRLVPDASGPPSFEGGARTSPPPASGMNDFIRKAAGRA